MDEPLEETPTVDLTNPQVTPASPVYLTKAEAIERVVESESTVKKYLREGRFPNAYKDDHGQWKIPASDLAGTGLTLVRPGMQPPENTPATPTPETTVTLTLSQYDQLRTAAAQAPVLRELADTEKIRANRAEQRIEVVERRILELEATPPTVETSPVQIIDLTELGWLARRKARRAVKRAGTR